MILLDTQVLIWYSQADEQLGQAARQRVYEATAVSEAAVSPMSFWEAAMLVEKSRISLDMTVHAWTTNVLSSGKIIVADLTP